MAVIETIATTYSEADAASVTFSSLGSYEHLRLSVNAKEENSAADRSAFGIRFNGDTGTNYGYVHFMGGLNTSATASSYTDADTDDLIYIQYGLIGGEGGTESFYSAATVDILDYRNTSKNTAVSYAVGWGGQTATPRGACGFGGDFWDSTAAVTSITVVGNPYSSLDFVRGSVFTLYGLNSS